jgi:hypothetical protein
MKIERGQTQYYVSKFSEEIRRNIGIQLEEITVQEEDPKKLPKNAVMCTSPGKIFINSKEDFNPRDITLEYCVLHELGHRTQHSLNPFLGCGLVPDNFLEFLKNLLAFNLVSSYGLIEGAAEYFALDIFPNFCNLSEKSKQF